MEKLSKQILFFDEPVSSIKKGDQNIPERLHCEALLMFDQHFESLAIEV